MDLVFPQIEMIDADAISRTLFALEWPCSARSFMYRILCDRIFDQASVDFKHYT